MVDWITQVLTKAEDSRWNPDDRNAPEQLQERPDGGKPERSERAGDPASDDPQ